MLKTKIFVGYYKPNFIFKSDVFQPILTSDANEDWDCDDLIKDKTGINIADKNKYYGELSGHYWVWKNFLPTTDVDYIGFCHYRRFLDFGITPTPKVPFKPMFEKEFKKTFKKYTEKKITECIDGYDIILPYKMTFKSILYSQYLKWHPQDEMNFALNIIRDNYPEYIEAAKTVMGSKKMYICLNFIMKKELFNEYMEWMFGIFTELENRTDVTKYVDYAQVRTPAFIAERFFNIWLEHVVKTRNLKVLETTSVFILGEDYGKVDPQAYIDKYDYYTSLFANSGK
ncbi:MAG: DUF4422 domain-containing protein [Candidatus Gastranaerophilales bacterium]|nr:DUF4422 domain-containing protein [Candidatus Gastranaerophilales bacterium]